MVPLTAGGLFAIEQAVGNLLDPLFLGHYLALTPTVVLVAVGFWTWVWGIPGALLGVPITLSIAVVARHYEPTRWVTGLLAADASKSRPDGA